MPVLKDDSTLNILIPVYNEGATIAATLESIALNLRPAGVDSRVTLVYDFDEDDTLPVVESLRARYPLPIHFQKNTAGGVCEAIKQGLLASRTAFVLVTMADMSDDHGKLPLMLEKARAGYDIVCGSRYMRGGSHKGGPLVKKTLSGLAGLSLHWLAGLPTHDATNSYKLYRRSILDEITLESTAGFEIGLEIVVKAFAKRKRIAEVPCAWRDRSQGKLRFRIVKWIPAYCRWYLYAFKARRAESDSNR